VETLILYTPKRKPQPGFNGATLSRTWKPGILRRPWRLRDRFNGATLSRTWKRPINKSEWFWIN